MAYGVEPIHPREFQAQRCRPTVRPVYTAHSSFGGLADARRELAVLHGPGHFGAINLHAADTEHGQDGHRQHDDAHAAQPAQQMPPQIDRSRQVLEARRAPCRRWCVSPEAASK